MTLRNSGRCFIIRRERFVRKTVCMGIIFIVLDLAFFPIRHTIFSTFKKFCTLVCLVQFLDHILLNFYFYFFCINENYFELLLYTTIGMYQKRNIKFLKLYFFLLGQEDLMFELIMQFNNKNFNRSMEGNLPALMTYRPTN